MLIYIIGIDYYTKVQNEEVYCTELVKPGEQTRRVSSPGLTKLSAIHCFVLYLSTCIPFIICHYIIFMRYVAVFESCNTTENIEQCSRPMKALDFTLVCNKCLHYLKKQTSAIPWRYVWRNEDKTINTPR